MSTSWAKNLVGCSLSETEMATIPRARTELYIHVTAKTAQSGGIIGSLLVAPAVTAYKGPKDIETLKTRMETYGKKGVLIGLAAGPIMTWMTLKACNASYDSIWDRCYRIRYNRNALRVERLSFIGAVAGFATATYLDDSGTLGALLGMSSGCILGVALRFVM